ncbi:MAG TPA: nitroreductase family protein [Candidatus Cloacimonadota bacterium]|nr:nitroreductase family protein [Candidatus Cloacimonadota bacterium]
MSGIIFLRTRVLDQLTTFYTETLQMELWLDQGACQIFQKGNLLLGFCQREEADLGGTITIFFPDRESVDQAYQRLGKIALAAPGLNPNYHIYHFYARDPEGRSLEFQHFEHALNPYHTTVESLMTRRSIRSYSSEPVPEALLNRVFELCRYSPTARNLQAYYYIVIKDPAIVDRIVELRGPAGEPLRAAPLTIAVAAKGEISRRVVQDACIAAYHLLLAAHTYGLGTCWVTDMDNGPVKDLLGIPHEDYVACLTPLGWPAEHKPVPQRHEVSEFVRYLS